MATIIKRISDVLRERIWAQRILYACLGVITGLPLIVPQLWPLALVGLAPLAYIALTASKKREVLIQGWFFGAGYLGVSWSWIFSMLPFAWLGVEHTGAGVAGAVIVWLILSTSLGWVPALWAYALARFRDHPPYRVLGLSLVLLPLLESARAVAFSLLAWSPGTGINAHFSLGAIGYGLAWSPGLLWIATFGGVAALSALCALASVVVAYALTRSRPLRVRGFSVLAALMLLGYFAPPAADVRIGERYAEIGGVSIALLQEDLAPTLMWDEQEARTFARSLAESLIDASEQAEIIVLPEDARFFASLDLLTREQRARIEEALARGVFTIESVRTDSDLGVRSVMAVRQGSALVHESEKSYLVPFGEYVPMSARLILGAVGFSRELEHLKEARASYLPGAFAPEERIIEMWGVRVGVTECSETFSPSIYRAIAHAGADVFVNLASHAWIQDDRALLFNQMLAMAMVHAVSAGIPYAQASAGAPTIVITPARAQ